MGLYILEMPVYDGAAKVWRILNLLSASVYRMEFETEEKARAAIADGETRMDMTVRGIDCRNVYNTMNAVLNGTYQDFITLNKKTQKKARK